MRDELDEVSLKQPVMLCHNDVHPFSFNSLGLKMIDPDRLTEGVLMDENGELTGFIIDPA
jgi:predicted amidohydrolase YtcJ